MSKGVIWTLVLTMSVIVTAQEDGFEVGVDYPEEPVPYPTFYSVPDTSFSCSQKWGLFADPEAQCQAFHLCQGRLKSSFLCPNGTLFHQNYFICDHWYNVRC